MESTKPKRNRPLSGEGSELPGVGADISQQARMKEQAIHHSLGEYKQEAKPRRGTCSPVLHHSPMHPPPWNGCQGRVKCRHGDHPTEEKPRTEGSGSFVDPEAGGEFRGGAGSQRCPRPWQRPQRDPRNGDSWARDTSLPESTASRGTSPWRLRHSGCGSRWCERRKWLSLVGESLCHCLWLGLRKDLA